MENVTGFKFYTRNGDNGESELTDTNERRRKNDIVFEALGTIDELAAHLKLCRQNYITFPEVTTCLVAVQHTLFDISVHIRSLHKRPFNNAERRISELEELINKWSALVSKFTITYDGASTYLDIARTVCRRAERCVVAIGFEDTADVAYLNRLGDLLFVCSHYINCVKATTKIQNQEIVHCADTNRPNTNPK